ncbi:hypothetical protein XENORESO_000036 [Xenotaenia resolanae]|uniref:Uncharacterized protein n=1 Tax=Xenotaenia resolanae TaxID=208358 RepID=A0ABV0VVI6_9TELE
MINVYEALRGLELHTSTGDLSPKEHRFLSWFIEKAPQNDALVFGSSVKEGCMFFGGFFLDVLAMLAEFQTSSSNYLFWSNDATGRRGVERLCYCSTVKSVRCWVQTLLLPQKVST